MSDFTYLWRSLWAERPLRNPMLMAVRAVTIIKFLAVDR